MIERLNERSLLVMFKFYSIFLFSFFVCISRFSMKLLLILLFMTSKTVINNALNRFLLSRNLLISFFFLFCLKKKTTIIISLLSVTVGVHSFRRFKISYRSIKLIVFTFHMNSYGKTNST